MSRLLGYDATLKFFNDLKGRAPRAARAVAETMAEVIYARSQELVPVSDPSEPGWRPSVDYSSGVGRQEDPGHLKSGGGWEVYETTSGGVKARVYYAASYAAYVHERFARHSTGQWKYLEQAVQDVAPRLQDIAANQWKSTMYGGYGAGRAFVAPGEEA